MYVPNASRYDRNDYRRCGASGVKLPPVSLGLWHNFGSVDSYANAVEVLKTAFDHGVTHFDLANNYGPEPGTAEETMGRILKREFSGLRDELLISTKAGYLMWPGPYGEWGSRKNLIASCDQSLKRLQLEYVDIFYSHRFDPETPLEETAGALEQIVRSGKALYAGISNYSAEQTERMSALLRERRVPFILHQFRYNLLDRRYEADGLFPVLEREKLGGIVFFPLAQGLLAGRYEDGTIPADSRAARAHFLKPQSITAELLQTLRRLAEVAERRGQTPAQLALAWLLNKPFVTSVLVGASRPSQLLDNLKATENHDFSAAELEEIETICGSQTK